MQTGSGEVLPNYTLIPVPFLICAFILLCIAIGTKCKDKSSPILPNILVLWSILEWIAYLVLGILAARDHKAYRLMAGALFAWVTIILLNIVGVIITKLRVHDRDEGFKYWSKTYSKTSKCIYCFSFCSSFKILRLFYSRFYGFEHFCANFEDPR